MSYRLTQNVFTSDLRSQESSYTKLGLSLMFDKRYDSKESLKRSVNVKLE